MDAVAACLGIDQGALAALRRSEDLPATPTPPEDLGDDMDWVLALRRDLDSLLTVQQADAVLGVKGRTLELLKLKLLNAFKFAGGTVLGVSLGSPELLCSGCLAVAVPPLLSSVLEISRSLEKTATC